MTASLRVLPCRFRQQFSCIVPMLTSNQTKQLLFVCEYQIDKAIVGHKSELHRLVFIDFKFGIHQNVLAPYVKTKGRNSSNHFQSRNPAFSEKSREKQPLAHYQSHQPTIR